MKNLIKTIIVIVAIAFLYSCSKKSDALDQSAKTNSLLVGKWLVVKKNAKIYALSNNALLKDSTTDYTVSFPSLLAWSEIYKADGKGYVTRHPYTLNGKIVVDTSSYLNYTFNNNVLIVSNTDGSNPTSSTVTRLEDKQLEYSTTSNRKPDSGWGLNGSTTYKYVEIYTYTRQ